MAQKSTLHIISISATTNIAVEEYVVFSNL